MTGEIWVRKNTMNYQSILKKNTDNKNTINFDCFNPFESLIYIQLCANKPCFHSEDFFQYLF